MNKYNIFFFTDDNEVEMLQSLKNELVTISKKSEVIKISNKVDVDNFYAEATNIANNLINKKCDIIISLSSNHRFCTRIANIANIRIIHMSQDIKWTQDILIPPDIIIDWTSDQGKLIGDDYYTIIKKQEDDIRKKLSVADIKVDVIIPFYNDHNIIACLKSILRYRDEYLNKVIIVDDQGEDEKVRVQVKEIVNQNSDLIEYYANDKNYGFTYSVNRGMEISENDVILLNSDTKVTSKWIKKINKTAYREDDIATVTPLSNSATHFSVPIKKISNEDKDPDQTNQFVERIAPNKYIEAFSAHGFCMYIKRKVLKHIGLFDYKTFGKGYGEENDFSLRAIEHGYKNVVACDTYIYHIHGQSFKESKKKYLKGKLELLIKMHPDLPKLMKEFEVMDPLLSIRKAMLIYHDIKNISGKTLLEKKTKKIIGDIITLEDLLISKLGKNESLGISYNLVLLRRIFKRRNLKVWIFSVKKRLLKNQIIYKVHKNWINSQLRKIIVTKDFKLLVYLVKKKLLTNKLIAKIVKKLRAA